MSQAITLHWTIPDDVQAFAEEQGVAAYLPAVLEATERIFPTARRRAVVLEEDPEISDLRWLVIEVDVPSTSEEALRARHQWHDAIRQCCPSTLICSFCLSMNLVE